MKTLIFIATLLFTITANAQAPNTQQPPRVYFHDLLYKYRHDGVKSPVGQACNDLMDKIRERYGRAPLCQVMYNRDGTSMSDQTNQIKLTTNGGNMVDVINVQPSLLGDSYHYSNSQISNLIIRIQAEPQLGLTKDETLGAYAYIWIQQENEIFAAEQEVWQQGGEVLADEKGTIWPKKLAIKTHNDLIKAYSNYR